MIRKMSVDDLTRVIEIENESFTSVYKKEQYEYELEDNPCAHLFVIEKEDTIVGFIDFWITFESCQLTKIAIASAYRGLGYACELMEFMFAFAEEQDCEAVILEVRESNLIAQSLYESYDFIEINRRERYYTDNNETAIVMGKPLKGVK